VASRLAGANQPVGCARDPSSCDECCQAAFRTALAGIRVNDVHGGRIRAGQQSDSALTGKTRAA
jgi:hypothetical protein